MAVARALQQFGDLIWLDSAAFSSGRGRWSFLSAGPAHRLDIYVDKILWDGAVVPGAPRDVLGRFIAAHESPACVHPMIPFCGGVAGYFTYEFAQHVPGLDVDLASERGALLAAVRAYHTVFALDHSTQQAWLVARNSADEEMFYRALNGEHSDLEIPRMDWEATISKKEYIQKINVLKEYIAAGDIYQANLAQRFKASLPVGFDPFEYYVALRGANPAPFAAYLDFGDRIIASASPERLLSADGEGRIEARPIKGTIRRFADAEADRAAQSILRASEKDRAENIMIVDLLRNDLSRVCAPHSVRVPELCQLETYEGLHHLVSSIEGHLSDGFMPLDAFLAAFPGGSITGAPKARAMEVIGELEGGPRGVFCGAIGYFGRAGTMDMSIPIRTVEFQNGEAHLHVGGGITQLSDPAVEYDETLLKAERIFAAQAATAEALI